MKRLQGFRYRGEEAPLKRPEERGGKLKDPFTK
jgi:hypothetical protein